MKKFLMMLAVFAGMFILAGCSDSPTDVAEKWVTALIDGDLETANECSTENVKMLNAMLISAAEKDEEQLSKMKATLDNLGDATEEIDGDTAKVYTEDNKDNPLTLKKVDGDWKVDVEK